MSQGIGLSLLLNRPYDHRNPYDEPEEVFDSWVSNLENTITAALHPPRKPLFPDPEPVYSLTPEKKRVQQQTNGGEGDVFGGRLQTTTSSREDEEEEGWPLPAALRSGGMRRSGEGLGEREGNNEEEGSGEEEEEGEDSDDDQPTLSHQARAGSSLAEAQVISDSDDDDGDQDQLQGSSPPPPPAAQMDENDLLMEEDEEVEPEGDYDEEDEEEEEEESDDDGAQQQSTRPPAQHRNAAQQQQRQSFPGFSSATNLDTAQQFVSAASSSRRVDQEEEGPEVIELSDSDDEEKPATTQQQHQPNGYSEEQEEEESWDEEEEEEEEDEVEQPSSSSRDRDPFAAQSQRFPPRPSQSQPTASTFTSISTRPPPVAFMEDESEDQLDADGVSYDEDSDELDAAESSSGPDRDEQEEGLDEDDDGITSFVPEVDEDIVRHAFGRTTTPPSPPLAPFTNADAHATEPSAFPLELARDLTLSPISSAMQLQPQPQHEHQSLIDDYPSGSPSEQDPASPTSDGDFPTTNDLFLSHHQQQPQPSSTSASTPTSTATTMMDSHTLQGLAAFLGQMEPPQPQSQQQPSFAPQIDPSLLQGEGVDLDADQLGRPLFGEEAREVVERDGDLVGWEEEEFVQKGEEGAGEMEMEMEMQEFVEEGSEVVEDVAVAVESEEMEIIEDASVPSAPPTAPIVDDEGDDDEIIAIDRPSDIPPIAIAAAPPPQPQAQAHELNLKAQLLRKKLLDAKSAKSPIKPKPTSPPPPPSSSTWQPSPERPSYAPFDGQASSSSSSRPVKLGAAVASAKPDEFELEHDAAIQPHLFPSPTTITVVEQEPSTTSVSTPASTVDDFEKEHEAAIQPKPKSLLHDDAPHPPHPIDGGIGPSPFAVQDVQEAPIYHSYPLVPGGTITLVPALQLSPPPPPPPPAPAPALPSTSTSTSTAAATAMDVVDLMDESDADEIEEVPSKRGEVAVDEEEDEEIEIVDEGSEDSEEEEEDEIEIEELGGKKESAVALDEEEQDEVVEDEEAPQSQSRPSSSAEQDESGTNSPAAADLVDFGFEEKEEEEEIKITSMSPATPEQSFSDFFANEITSPDPDSSAPLISFDDVDVGVQVEKMEDEIEGESLNVGGEEMELDEFAGESTSSSASAALVGVMSDAKVRAALASIHDQSKKGVGSAVEEVDELDQEEEEGGETVPTGEEDFIGFVDSEDEQDEQDNDENEPEIFYAGPSSPLYFPSSDDDDNFPLPAPLEEEEEEEEPTSPRSTTPTPSASIESDQQLPSTSSSFPDLFEPAVEPSLSRILPGVIKAGLWDKDEFPPFFASPGAGSSKVQKKTELDEEPSTSSTTTSELKDVFLTDNAHPQPPAPPSPIPSTQTREDLVEANFPDPRAAPPPTTFLTPDVPVTTHVEESLVVEGGETRQVTPVPSEQVEEMEMDYDEGLVDDSDRQPVDLEEAIERNRRRIEEEEEFTSDSIPLEAEPSVVPSYVEPRTPPKDEPSTPLEPLSPARNSADPSIVPSYVEPETPPRDEPASGPPSPGFAPVATFNDLPDPSLPPPPTTFLVPDVPRHLSPPEQSLVSEANESRAITPPPPSANEDVDEDGEEEEEEENKENIPPTDEELAAAVLGSREDGSVWGGGSSRSRSESGSSQGSVDYGLDASNSGDSDDDVVGIVEAKSEDGEEQEEGGSRVEELPSVVEDFDEEEAPQPVALPSTLESRTSENDIVPTSDPSEADDLLLDITPFKASESSPPRPNPFARTVVPPSGEEAPPSFPFPSQPEASTSTSPHRPSALVFEEPEPMSPVVVDSEREALPVSRPSLHSSSSRSLSYHVHGSRSSRAGPSFAPPPSSISRSTLPSSSSTSTLASTSNLPIHPSPMTVAQPPISSSSSSRTSPSSRTIALSKQPEPPTSPVTRSQCVYHLLRIPGTTRYAETIIFVVPWCSLALVDAIEEENARVMGKASDEDNEARKEIVGEGRVVIGEEMEQKLTRICGIDIVRAGECFYLRSVPREEEDGSAPEESDEHEEKEKEEPSPSKPSSSKPTSRSKPLSSSSSTGGAAPSKRKRTSGDGLYRSRGGEEESDDDESEEKKASPAKRRSPRKSSPEKEVALKEDVEEEEGEVAETSAQAVKRKRSEGGEAEKEGGEVKKVKASATPKKKRGGLFGRFFG